MARSHKHVFAKLVNISCDDVCSSSAAINNSITCHVFIYGIQSHS
jgi:hypothetical protein